MGHEYQGEGAARQWQPGLIACAQIDSKTEKGGVVKRHSKKRRKWKTKKKKRSRRPEAKEIVFKGLLLVPIHRDTLKDLKLKRNA